MNHMTYAQQADILAGPIGLLKAQCTRVAGEIADECVSLASCWLLVERD